MTAALVFVVVGASASTPVGATKPSLESIRSRYFPLEGGTWVQVNVEQSLIHQAVLPGDFVFEVGTNIGRSTIVAAESVGPSGRVVTCEPDPAPLACEA